MLLKPVLFQPAPGPLLSRVLGLDVRQDGGPGTRGAVPGSVPSVTSAVSLLSRHPDPLVPGQLGAQYSKRSEAISNQKKDQILRHKTERNGYKYK